MRLAPLLLVVACGTKPQTQTPTPVASASAAPTNASPSILSTACGSDSDCVITSFTGCCDTCPDAPRAVTRLDLERHQKACAEVECAQQKGRVRCEPTERADAFRAVCLDRVCQTVKAPQAPPPTAELTSSERCTKDEECIVSNFAGCCSSCPAPAFATSQKALLERNRVCAAVDCMMQQTVRCEPTTDAALYRATCRAGTCAGVKR